MFKNNNVFFEIIGTTQNDYFEIDKEILTFKSEQEMLEKFKAIIGKESIIKEIAKNGYNRFIKEHESKVRLSGVLDKIKNF